MTFRVKVCGITRPEDAEVAAELGADAIGINFVPDSPRCVSLGQAREIQAALPPDVHCVAVVASPTEAELQALAAEPNIDTVQFHGEETPAECRRSPLPWIKAFRTGEGFDVRCLAAYGEGPHLLDAWQPGVRGGTGQQADWDAAAEAARHYQVILAGGIGPHNAQDAIAAVQPHGLDVNSGVETAPGIKDAVKLESLFDRLRDAGFLG